MSQFAFEGIARPATIELHGNLEQVTEDLSASNDFVWPSARFVRAVMEESLEGEKRLAMVRRAVCWTDSSMAA